MGNYVYPRGKHEFTAWRCSINYLESREVFPAASRPLDGRFTGTAVKYEGAIPDLYKGRFVSGGTTYSGLWSCVVTGDTRYTFLSRGTVVCANETRSIRQRLYADGTLRYCGFMTVQQRLASGQQGDGKAVRSWWFRGDKAILCEDSLRVFHAANGLNPPSGPVVEVNDATGERFEGEYVAGLRHGIGTRYYPQGDSKRERWNHGLLVPGEPG